MLDKKIYPDAALAATILLVEERTSGSNNRAVREQRRRRILAQVGIMEILFRNQRNEKKMIHQQTLTEPKHFSFSLSLVSSSSSFISNRHSSSAWRPRARKEIPGGLNQRTKECKKTNRSFLTRCERCRNWRTDDACLLHNRSFVCLKENGLAWFGREQFCFPACLDRLMS